MRQVPWLTLITILIYLFVLAPIVVVIGVAFDDTGHYEFPPTHLSLRWFRAFFASPAYLASFVSVSLPIGLAVAIVAALFGLLTAVALTRYHFPGRRVAEVFFASPLFIPEVLLASALYLTYSRAGIKGSMLSIIAGHLIIATPYVVRTLTAGLAGIDLRLEEAARNLGASPLQAFFHATLPLLQSSLVSGCVFAFVVSFSDINLALFLSGPGTTTLPVHIFSQLEFQDDPTIAAASALQVLLVGLLLFGLQRLFRLNVTR